MVSTCMVMGCVRNPEGIDLVSVRSNRNWLSSYLITSSAQVEFF
jgi:hypothetical protein